MLKRLFSRLRAAIRVDAVTVAAMAAPRTGSARRARLVKIRQTAAGAGRFSGARGSAQTDLHRSSIHNQAVNSAIAVIVR
jgi:hypothetical protein